MPTRSSARRSTQSRQRARDASHSVVGGYCLGSHVERARRQRGRRGFLPPSRPYDGRGGGSGFLRLFFIPMTTSLPSQFKVGLVQMSMSDDTEANLGKAVARIRDAAQQGATLVCLPELFRTQYIGQREDHALFDLAEAVPGPTTETLGKIAKENGTVVIASLFERLAAGL